MVYKDILLRGQDTIGLEKIYSELFDLQEDYPNFNDWYYKKVIPQLETNRKILLIEDVKSIAGVLIIKDGIEKKICTLRVNVKYQRQGLGTHLILKSFDLLKTYKPIITVSEPRLFQFDHLLSKFGFKKMALYQNYYLHGINEYAYNGYLRKSNAYSSNIAL